MASEVPDYLQQPYPPGTYMGGAPAADGGQPQFTPVNIQSVPAGMGRKWDLTCFHCAGHCDGPGWGICILSTFCFPCTFGFLKYRAFGSAQRALAWAVLFIFMTIVTDIYVRIFFESVDDDDSTDPAEQEPFFNSRHDDDDDDGGNKWSYDSRDVKVREKYRDDESTIVAVYWVVGVVAFLTMTIAGAWNRMQLRKKFTIDGPSLCCEGAPELEDACVWTFCKPCALCQEVRTMVRNRVEGGVWQGEPGTVAANAATGIPASGVVMVPLSHATAPPQQDFADTYGKG